MIRHALIALCLSAGAAGAADFEFCWIGSNGYTLDGTMTVPEEVLSKPLVRGGDVTAFRITGYLDGQVIGSWDLGDLTPDTTWNLSFDPGRMVFPTGGNHMGPDGQAWNANGSVDDCGTPGFGFNSGTNAQDVCWNDRWITDSMVARFKPFPVFPAGLSEIDCGGPALIG